MPCNFPEISLNIFPTLHWLSSFYNKIREIYQDFLGIHFQVVLELFMEFTCYSSFELSLEFVEIVMTNSLFSYRDQKPILLRTAIKLPLLNFDRNFDSLSPQWTTHSVLSDGTTKTGSIKPRHQPQSVSVSGRAINSSRVAAAAALSMPTINYVLLVSHLHQHMARSLFTMTFALQCSTFSPFPAVLPNFEDHCFFFVSRGCSDELGFNSSKWKSFWKCVKNLACCL